MEESMSLKDFLLYYKRIMGLEPVDVETYSPLVLAYLGDAVYEVMIRSKVMNQGNRQVSKMHRQSASLVKASAQAKMIQALAESLTEEERVIYKRGRNAKSATTAKHATIMDYRMATGFEALMGWLFLKERFERMAELVSRGLELSGLISALENKENLV